MPEMNRVKVSIHGIEYTLLSESSPEYICSLAAKLEERLDSLLMYGKMAITTALMLCGINALDEATSAESESQHLREQNQSWVQAVQNLKDQLDAAQNRAAADGQTIDALRAQLLALQSASPTVSVAPAQQTTLPTAAAADPDADTIRQQLDAAQQERDDLRNALAACEAACDWLRSENETLSGAARQPDPEAVLALQNAKETVEKLEAQVAQLTAQRDEAITSMKEAAAREATAVPAGVMQRVSELTAENERLQAALAAVQQASADAQTAHQNADAAVQELENLRRINQEQANDIEWLMSELELAQKEAAAAKEEAANAKSECSTLHALLRSQN